MFLRLGALFSGQKGSHVFIVSEQGSEVHPPGVITPNWPLWRTSQKCVWSSGLKSKRPFSLCWRSAFPWRAQLMGKGISSGAFFSCGTSNSVDLQGEVIACGLSDFMWRRALLEGLLELKQKLWMGFPSFPLYPYFLLSAWEPLQRIRCVDARRHAVIVKRIWKYNWKQTLSSGADLGEFLTLGEKGIPSFCSIWSWCLRTLVLRDESSVNSTSGSYILGNGILFECRRNTKA